MFLPKCSHKINEFDVEQIVHASLEQQGYKKSQHKIKGGASRGHRGNSVGIAWNLSGWRETTFWSRFMIAMNEAKI